MDTPSLPEISGSILLDGTSYSVPLPEESHYLELADWLGDRALARIERQRGKIPESAFAERYDAVMRLVTAGVLSPGQPEFDRALTALESRERLLLIMLRSKHPEVTEAMVSRYFRGLVKDALARVRAGAEPRPEPEQKP